MKNAEKKQLIVINLVYILALAAILCPLLIISKYNYPSADDWSFGIYVHEALQNHEGIAGGVKAVMNAVASSYENWEGRFSSTLFACLQPGAWGERFYGIVAYLMLGSLVLSEIFLVWACLRGVKGGGRKWLLLPICIPVLILQILYCPYPEESFYWYTGGVNYTLVYGLSLILVALTFQLGFRELSGRKYAAVFSVACLLAILIGGNNFATSLSTLCALIILDFFCLIYNKPAFKRIWFVTLPIAISFGICMMSPGLQKRLDGNFEGEVLFSPLEAVGMSFVRSFYNIIGWTDWKVLFVILLILPFVWMAVRQMPYHFKMPLLFTAITYGLYSSQITATLYVDGTTGGGRQGAILWYSYLIWIVGNICYWIGWISQRDWSAKAAIVQKVIRNYLIPYCVICGAALVCVVYLSGIEVTTSYRAYRLWRNGWAKQYGDAWEARLKILKDDTIKRVEFTPLQPIDLLMYTDLQPEKGYYWVTTACASYYDKEYIHIITEEE